MNRIKDFAGEDSNVFIITGDAGYGVLDEYQRLYPERFLNLGVAEQNMISFGAGLGLAGFKVFMYNIIPFILYRCYEQVRNDICYQKLPITLIGIGSGVTYAPQGMTHYSVEDIALARTLPNLTILSPADPQEALRCVEFAYRSKNPVYIRIAKTGEPAIHEDVIEDINKPILCCKGQGVAVLFHGSVGIEVTATLKNIEVSPLVMSVPMIHPLPFQALSEGLQDIHTIITVEEHYSDGGLGSSVGEWILRERLPYKLTKLGIKNGFVHAIKDNKGMRELYGISSDKIKTVIEEAFSGG